MQSPAPVTSPALQRTLSRNRSRQGKGVLWHKCGSARHCPGVALICHTLLAELLPLPIDVLLVSVALGQPPVWRGLRCTRPCRVHFHFHGSTPDSLSTARARLSNCPAVALPYPDSASLPR